MAAPPLCVQLAGEGEGALDPQRLVARGCESPWMALQAFGRSGAERRQTMFHNTKASFVRKKSAIRIVMEMATTVFVVLRPTPAVPPRVRMP